MSSWISTASQYIYSCQDIIYWVESYSFVPLPSQLTQLIKGVLQYQKSRYSFEPRLEVRRFSHRWTCTRLHVHGMPSNQSALPRRNDIFFGTRVKRDSMCHVMHVWPWIRWTGFCAVVLLRVLLMAHCLNMGASLRQLPTLVESYEFFVQSNLRPRNLILATKMLSVVVVCCAQPIMCLKM